MSRPGGDVLQANTTVEVLRSVESIGRADWERLAVADNVFYGYDFLCSIERDPLTRPATPYYLLARDRSGAPSAALVLSLQETVDPFATDPDAGVTRMLVGHIWHCYDTTVPSAGTLESETVAALCATMGTVAGELDVATYGLVNIPWQGDLAGLLAEAGLPGQETTPRYRLPIPPEGLTLDDHLATIGRASRRSLRQYMRRAERAGARITFEEGATVLDDAALALCTATADKHAPGYYPPEELSALIRALGPDCRILRIELDGVLQAVSICLLDEQRAHFWAGGCLYPEELNWSPQYVLFGAELEYGMASGKPVVEFGRRNDEFKRRYGLHPQRLGRFMVSR